MRAEGQVRGACCDWCVQGKARRESAAGGRAGRGETQHTWRKALSAAILKASSLESTAWEAPSVRVTRTLSTGWPVSPPDCTASRNPFSMAVMNPGLIADPTIPLTNSKFSGLPSGSGSMRPTTRPYCPCPPDCFLWR